MKLGISVLGFLGLILSVDAYWNNWWDEPLSFVCPFEDGKYGSISRIESYHSNYREDRRYHFECRNDINRMGTCQWSGYVNNWDETISYFCPNNGYVAAVYSYHSNHHEDRRWDYGCCELPDGIHDCYWSGWINNWDEYMDYVLGANRIIHGIYSVHSNYREDRVWQLYTCQVKFNLLASADKTVSNKQSFHLGVFEPHSRIVRNKPTWKKVNEDVYIYYSGWNSWRIGENPDTNLGGITAYDNSYGDSPQKITQWLYWNDYNWVYSSSIKVEFYNGKTRSIEDYYGSHNNTKVVGSISGATNPAEKNRIENENDEEHGECNEEVANILIQKENFCNNIDNKVQGLKPKSYVPGVMATLNSFRFSQGGNNGITCEDKITNLVNEKQGFCVAFSKELKKFRDNNKKAFVSNKLENFCSSTDENENSFFNDFDDEKELSEEEKEENKKKFEDQENQMTTPATGKN